MVKGARLRTLSRRRSWVRTPPSALLVEQVWNHLVAIMKRCYVSMSKYGRPAKLRVGTFSESELLKKTLK